MSQKSSDPVGPCIDPSCDWCSLFKLNASLAEKTTETEENTCMCSSPSNAGSPPEILDISMLRDSTPISSELDTRRGNRMTTPLRTVTLSEVNSRNLRRENANPDLLQEMLTGPGSPMPRPAMNSLSGFGSADLENWSVILRQLCAMRIGNTEKIPPSTRIRRASISTWMITLTSLTGRGLTLDTLEEDPQARIGQLENSLERQKEMILSLEKRVEDLKAEKRRLEGGHGWDMMGR